MTAQEKAKELFHKMYDHQIDKTIWTENHDNKEAAKQCALIAVDEVIKELENLLQGDYDSELSFWDKVKQEIEKL